MVLKTEPCLLGTAQACCRHQQNNKYLIFPDQRLLSLTWHDKQQGLDGKSYLLNLPCQGKQTTFVLALGVLNFFSTVLTFSVRRIPREQGWFSPHLDILERGYKFDWAKFSMGVQQKNVLFVASRKHRFLNIFIFLNGISRWNATLCSCQNLWSAYKHHRLGLNCWL